jgi:TorA maturation chaperone TorD
VGLLFIEDDSMTVQQSVASTNEIDLAREVLYRFLAAALADDRGGSSRLLYDPASRQCALEAADLLREAALAERSELGLGELRPEDLRVEPTLERLDRIDDYRAEFGRVFGLAATKECPLYETEYCECREPFFRSQQMADVAGFYRAFGIKPSLVSPERPDHLSLELEFMAFLLLKTRLAAQKAVADPAWQEQVSVCRDAAEKFFREHLVWWAPAVATFARSRDSDGLFGAVGQLLAAFLPMERQRYGIEALCRPVQPTEPEEPAASCDSCASAPELVTL